MTPPPRAFSGSHQGLIGGRLLASVMVPYTWARQVRAVTVDPPPDRTRRPSLPWVAVEFVG